MQVVHAVGPCLLRIVIKLPSVGVFCFRPVWHCESLVESSWSSVEGHIADSLQESVGMEVLSIHVIHDVGLLVEFDGVHVLNSDTYSIIIN